MYLWYEKLKMAFLKYTYIFLKHDKLMQNKIQFLINYDIKMKTIDVFFFFECICKVRKGKFTLNDHVNLEVALGTRHCHQDKVDNFKKEKLSQVYTIAMKWKREIIYMNIECKVKLNNHFILNFYQFSPSGFLIIYILL